jgi:adenosine deaminase
VVALGLGGPEVGNPPEKFIESFKLAQTAGLPCVPHAGETQGAESMWSALNVAHGVRMGHGVRCLEDANLVEELRARQIPLDVCPTSNVCLHVAPSIEEHPLPRLLEEGLYVTLNSDDPALFNTTLTDEYLKTAQAFGWNTSQMDGFSLRALRAALLPDEQKAKLEAEFQAEFASLRKEHLF